MDQHLLRALAAMLLLSIACFFPLGSSAQITAAQGVSSTTQDAMSQSNGQFQSPMMLTGPFPLADRKLWGSTQWSDPDVFQQFADRRCDGIAITRMQMRGTLDKDGRLQVEVKGEFDSIASHDKQFNLEFAFLNDDEVIAVAFTPFQPAAQGTATGFQVDFWIPTNRIREEPPTRLRIRFADRDN